MQTNILTVNTLSMRFGGLVALNQVSLSAKRHNITTLIGPNGAGKTTLFNCLTGFYAPQAGELLFHNRGKTYNLRQILGEPFHWHDCLKPRKLISDWYYRWFGGSHLATSAGIARTFQTVRLFKEMTVIENLLVAQHLRVDRNPWSGLFNLPGFAAKEKQAIEVAYDWLEKFDLVNDANRLAQELPFGKQRYLEIARAMCTQPALLCLDEPAAGLNAQETHTLCDRILALKESHQISVLLIEHDMSMVMKISDHIVVLDHGQVICAGTPEQVQKDPRVIAAYLGVESS